MKTRIVERIGFNGDVQYVIQQKRFLFFWWAWIDAFISYNSARPRKSESRNYFGSLEEAEKNLCYFDGSSPKERVVVSNGERVRGVIGGEPITPRPPPPQDSIKP